MTPSPPGSNPDDEKLFEHETPHDEAFDEAFDEEFDEDDEAEWGGDGEAPVPPPPLEPVDSGESDDDLITVATFRTAAEAELAKTALDAEGVASFIADAETVAMDWLLGIAIGDVKLQVARRDATQARRFLALHRQPQEAGSSAPPTCLACGAPFPEDAEKCPSCGWSFADKPE